MNTTTKTDALKHCLPPLLDALNWPGEQRHLIESMPHFANTFTLPMLNKVMSNLHFQHYQLTLKLTDVDERLLPCLFICEDGTPLVLLTKKDNKLSAFDGQQEKTIIIDADNTKGKVTIYTPAQSATRKNQKNWSWFSHIFTNYKGLLTQAITLSFFLNILALATPLFIMATYDYVIGGNSFDMLRNFLIGAILAISGIAILQRIRAKILAYIGGNIDRELGNNIMERLLYLAPAYTESATIGAQVARIKDFDSMRAFLTGPLVSVLFELPFIVVSLIVVGILGGTLLFVPITMIAIFALLSWIFSYKLRDLTKQANEDNAVQQEFLLESLSNMRALKYTGAQKKWQDRYREISANSCLSNFNTTLFGAITNSLADIIMISSGIAILSIGVLKVLNNHLTLGALIAIMILVWRVLAPIKTLFITLPRIQQVLHSAKQVGQLFTLQTENRSDNHRPKKTISL